MQHGPFEPRFFRRLPSRGWTLLVQDVNHFVAQGRELLQRFDFIPYFRLDDLMVSYAPAGGGVGPHFDSYDVFLLQGLGRRLWRVSNQRDLALVVDAPLKLLADFRAQQEWMLDAGDMLYLPPAWAHDGVAADDCMTYSIGFRAPAWQELAVQFLSHLQDRVRLARPVRRPGSETGHAPGRLGRDLLRATVERFERHPLVAGRSGRFLGADLTEPKPHVFFAAAAPGPVLACVHAARAVRAGVALELKTQMLYDGNLIFINGESVSAILPAPLPGACAPACASWPMRAACSRTTRIPRHSTRSCMRWYRAGYLSLSGARRSH